MSEHRSKTGMALRQRGALLLDSILALAVIGSVLVVILLILDQEGKRQEDTITASTLRALIVASQEFLGENYDDLRIELADAALTRPDESALLAVSMQRLSNEGYISTAFLDSGHVTNMFGQNFDLLLRGVDPEAGGFPTPTMSAGDISEPDDMEIESVLVSYGGEPVPGQRGGPIVAKTGLFNAGFMISEHETRGPLGSFAFTLGNEEETGAYNSFSHYPGKGRFASLISLADLGVLGIRSGDGGGVDDPFRRCADIDRSNYPEEYDECIAAADENQRVYSDIIFNVRTERGGTVKTPPAIRNLKRISCQDDEGPWESDALYIDCSTTKFSGALEVGDFEIVNNVLSLDGKDTIYIDGDKVVVEGDRIVTPEIEGENGELLLDGNPDQNFYDLVFNYERVLPGEVVTAPSSCGTPEVFLSVESVSDKYGRPIAGHRAYATPDDDINPTEWEVGILSFSTENFCTTTKNDSPNPILLEPVDPQSNPPPEIFDYRRIVLAGQEFGFPILNGGQRAGVQCAEFVDDSGNTLGEGEIYSEIFILDEWGDPIDDENETKTRLEAVSDEFVDIYDVPEGYGYVNMQIRCERP